MGSGYFHPCFIPSQYPQSSHTDRDLEKRKDAVCVGAVVAEQVSMNFFREQGPERSYVLQTGDESAHCFGSCGYCVSFWAFE